MSKRKRSNYTNEFKEESVKLVTEKGYSIAEAARNLGVNANLLGRWKKEVEEPTNEITSPGNMVTMQAELKRLRKENKQLKMEREILKKAAVFFIKEQE
jgi:transposase